MLVQITPVATGKGSQSTSIDGTKKHGDGISNRANGTAPICRCSSAVANHVSTTTSTQATTAQQATTHHAPSSLASSTREGGGAASVSSSGATPSTSKPSTIGQSSGQFGAKSRSGSLDQLLFLTDRLAAHTLQRQENRHTGQKEITVDDLFNYLKDLNGDLKFLDKKKLAQLLLQNTEAFVAQQHQHVQQHPTGTIRKHQPASRQESTGETKQIQFVNHVGPTPSSSIPVDAPTKGILQTARKGSKFDSVGSANNQQQKEFSEEWLERSQFQRASSRSVTLTDASTLPKECGKDELKQQQRHHKHHQRHFSGPEELEALKKDIAHWLERLPYKRDTALLELIETAVKLKQQQKQQQQATTTTLPSSSGTKPKSIIKNEFCDIIRPPLPQKQRQSALQQQQPPPLPVKQFQRQKSADDLRVLKNNILEWLTKQQIMNQQRSIIQQKQQQKQQSVPSNSAIIDMLSNELKSADRTGPVAAVNAPPSVVPPPLPRKTHQKVSKRHSLGPSETSSDFHEFPDWMQIPIDKLSKIREIQKSCTDIPKKASREKSAERPKHSHSTSIERKLRHSASEVVQSNLDRSYMKSIQQQPQQHFQYQIIPQPQPSSYQYQPPQQQQILVHQSQGAVAVTSQQQPQLPQIQAAAAQPQYQVVQRRSKVTGSDKSHHSHHGHHSTSNNIERSSKRDKPRHRQTQRSATTGNILLNKNQQQHHQQPQPLPTHQNHVVGGVMGDSNFYQSQASLVRCDDPMCPLLPICTDPNCYLNANSYYDTPRRASLPLQDVVPLQDDICTDPRCCEMLPLCTDPRCCGATIPSSACSKSKPIDVVVSSSRCNSSATKHKFKSNSLPRCVESTRRTDPFLSDLSKNESYSSLPKSATLSSATAVASSTSSHHRPRHHQHHTRQSKFHQQQKQLQIPKNQMLFDGQDNQSLMQQMMPILKQLSSSSSSQHRHGGNGSGNNKLLKSASTTSLHSRRRRHKTVTFGENLLREVCMNRELIKPLTDQQPSNSTSARLQPNIQMLYNFVEGVLSAWVDEEDDDHIKSGPDSEPERGAALKPFHRCNRARLQTIRRIVNEAASLKGTLKLGNSRYRHRHWRGTAKDCNERFLRKVNFNSPSNKRKKKSHKNFLMSNVTQKCKIASSVSIQRKFNRRRFNV